MVTYYCSRCNKIFSNKYLQEVLNLNPDITVYGEEIIPCEHCGILLSIDRHYFIGLETPYYEMCTHTTIDIVRIMGDMDM